MPAMHRSWRMSLRLRQQGAIIVDPPDIPGILDPDPANNSSGVTTLISPLAEIISDTGGEIGPGDPAPTDTVYLPADSLDATVDSTAGTGCGVSAGVVLRLNIWDYFTVKTKRADRRPPLQD